MVFARPPKILEVMKSSLSDQALHKKYAHRLLRVITRGLQNPICEVKWQYWNLRDKLFVRKIGEYYKYQGEMYPEYLMHGNAAKFIHDKAKKYCRGRGLDIGAGKWPFEGAIPIEDEEDQNAYNLDDFEDNSLDYIFSSHCLEHLERWKDALKLWIRKIKVEGILFLYLPHESMKMWRPCGPWARHHHVWIPTVDKIKPFLIENGMEMLDFNSDKDEAWGFHIAAVKSEASAHK